MNARLLLAAAVVLPLVTAGCRGCDDQTNKVKAVLTVSPTSLDFGQVKVGDSGEGIVKLTSQSQTSVVISGITVEDGSIPGSAAAYTVVDAPEVVPTLGNATFSVRFAPTALQAYDATLVVASNDPDHPRIEVALNGEGAHPVMTVTPECDPAQKCRGTAVVDPPSLDFGAEPLSRAVPIPVTQLPRVTVVNESEVALVLSKIAIEGEDPTAFILEGGGAQEDAMTLDAGAGVSLSIRFKPTSEQQTDYRAELVLQGDDPDHPEVRVPLTGTLGPNLPPQVCANISKVKPGIGSGQLNYDTAADWAPLLVPPPGGYDFTNTRNIDPKATVTFSAFSNATDDSTCTTDPEDLRQGLVYKWEMTQWPGGGKKVKLAGDTSPIASLTAPAASGAYEVDLTVTDAQGHSTTVPIRFAVVIKEDLVVQLSWDGHDRAYAGVDLDVHLVRPSSAVDPKNPFSGVFSYFEEGPDQDTSGDVNGFSNQYLSRPGVSALLGFHWGDEPDTSDDPRLNLDDLGNGELYENVSLNFPEHDPDCATQACRYKVFVHYFKDGRNHPSAPSCNTGGTCTDGTRCDCSASSDRCVFNDAPKGAAANGPGKCFEAPEPVVRIFFKGDPNPAAVIPLQIFAQPDDLRIGAPCQMLYVADVVWPARNSAPPDGGTGPQPTVEVKGADAEGRISNPELSRFGIRLQGGLECTANVAQGGSSLENWFSEEPL